MSGGFSEMNNKEGDLSSLVCIIQYIMDSLQSVCFCSKTRNHPSDQK